MAIFSLHHKTIGRTTHKPGTAGAHIRYICRAGTMRTVLRNGFPESPFTMATWLNKQEEQERKNARMLDKIMVALPLELTEREREDLVVDYLFHITQDKVYWVAAFHDLGKDANNPHCHIAIYDRCLETHRALCSLSEQGSTQMLRELWAKCVNAYLVKVGVTDRVDHRSLKEQGIDRKPQIHEGVRARAMRTRGVEPVSQDKIDHRGREIRYTEIDEGSRASYNEGLKEQ